MIELPTNLNGLLRMEDVSGFHAERYYLGKTQWDLFEKIKRGVAVTLKLREYGIPYKNSTLIYGMPGTGKTEFARYVAYSLGHQIYVHRDRWRLDACIEGVFYR